MKDYIFSFEDLSIWQNAINFATDIFNVIENIETHRKHFRLFEQLETSATSIAANIAEGKGRYSKKEFIHYLYNARGSLFETITYVIIFRNKDWITDKKLHEILLTGSGIGKGISGLINSIKQSMR